MEKALPTCDFSISEDFADDCLACIFSHVGKRDLLNVMLACRRFHEVVNTSSFFLKFCQAKGYSLPPVEWRKFAKSENREFDYRRIAKGFDPYGCIRPEDRSPFSKIISGTEIPMFNDRCSLGPFRRECHRLGTESPPKGLAPPETEVPSQFDTCFVTSCEVGWRKYTIDLVGLGIQEWVLDYVRPRIIIEEWSAPRFDCTSEYQLMCTLTGNGIQSTSLHTRFEHRAPGFFGFERKTIVLDDYSEGFRTLTIESKGSAGTWDRGRGGPRSGSGIYGRGCKFAGLSIRLEFPSNLEFVHSESESESSSCSSFGGSDSSEAEEETDPDSDED